MPVIASLECPHTFANAQQTACPVCTGFLLGVLTMAKAFEEMDRPGLVDLAKTAGQPKQYLLKSSGCAQALESSAKEIPQSSGSLLALSNKDVSSGILSWARRQGIGVSFEDADSTTAYNAAVASGELKATDNVVIFNTSITQAGDVTDIDEKRAALPVSMPVGGIITPQ